MPRPNGESEDDGERSFVWHIWLMVVSRPSETIKVSPSAGVVLSVVINSNPGQKCYIVVIDGRTFKEVARAYTAAELHKDVHGIFIPNMN